MERWCNNCSCRRARWFCPADDAFLCQPCDALVHCANALAGRHQRVPLKTESPRPGDLASIWHPGFTIRKRRTPRRHAKHKSGLHPHEPLVPDLGRDDMWADDDSEEPEQLLYRVPTYDPYDAAGATGAGRESTAGPFLLPPCYAAGPHDDFRRTTPFLTSEVEIAEEFAADVESLLGSSGAMEPQSFGMDDLGLLDGKRKEPEWRGAEPASCLLSHAIVPKIKEEEDDSAAIGGINGGKIAVGETERNEEEIRKNNILLRLDYVGVMAAWEGQGQGSPWSGTDRPELHPHDCWPANYCMGMEVHYGRNYEDAGGFMGGRPSTGPATGDDGEREARVSRYREKRRTRLFSKKIRYEVRKLNAEKRPRMKGRFVKRASVSGTSAAPLASLKK